MNPTNKARSRIRRWVLAGLALACVAAATGWSRVQPSSSGTWAWDHARIPPAQFEGSRVTIHNFRNFEYRSAQDFTEHYEQRVVDLDQIESVWYIVTPFKSGRGAAHTFLSFGFADSTFVAVSVEARREPDEGYSLLHGVLKRYEVIYVIGDERDLIGMRAIHRNDRVLVYPIRTDVTRIRSLFVDIMDRTNQLSVEPEFYNTITNNCTTNILRHVNAVAPEPIRYGTSILFPANSDKIAYERGLIETEESLEGARERFDVSARAKAARDASDFSHRIRTFPEPGS